MAEEERGQERGSHEGENLRGEGKAPLERLPLFPWVVSLVHSSNVINRNSEPEKCYTKTELSEACYHSKILITHINISNNSFFLQTAYFYPPFSSFSYFPICL